MNILRIIGDQLRLFSTFMLLFKILKTRSCEGISGKSQILIAIMCTTRYLDVITVYISLYNTSEKLLLTSISYITVFLIYVVFKKTYEQEHDKFRIEFLIFPAALLAVALNHEFSILEILWTFSIYLEAVTMVPQLILIVNTGQINTIVGIYVCLMASYRCIFYPLNWLYRYIAERHYDLLVIVSFVAETIIYCYFLILIVQSIRKRKKAYRENLKAILSSPGNLIIGDESVRKVKQTEYNNQDLEQEQLNENEYTEMMKKDYPYEIPDIHQTKY